MPLAQIDCAWAGRGDPLTTRPAQGSAGMPADSLRQSKALFARRLARMHAVAVKVAKKQQHKINKLTGVVTANAIKSAKGRAMLKSMQSANKRDISHAISVAIQKGEQRAIAVEKKMRSINKKNKAALSAKVSTMISSLRKSTSKSIYALDMESKAARKALKKEVLFAVKSAPNHIACRELQLATIRLKIAGTEPCE